MDFEGNSPSRKEPEISLETEDWLRDFRVTQEMVNVTDQNGSSPQSLLTLPELPFASEYITVLSTDSNNADVYELKTNGRDFVIKDIRNVSFTLENFPGANLQQKAKYIKIFFDVVKEHLGDRAWSTDFIIAKNGENKPCLRVIQEKVDGWKLKDIRNRLRPDYIERINEVVKKARESLEEAFGDERLQGQDYSKAVDWVRKDAFYDGNIFIQRDGRVVFVDLI